MNGQAEQHWICRLTNQPHQFSYESGVEVTHVEPGRAEGVLTVGPDSINPHGKVHGGALGHSGGYGGGLLCLRPRAQLRDLRQLHGVPEACGRGPDHLYGSPQKGGANPVRHPGGAAQWGGGPGGHRHLHLFHV